MAKKMLSRDQIERVASVKSVIPYKNFFELSELLSKELNSLNTFFGAEIAPEPRIGKF